MIQNTKISKDGRTVKVIDLLDSGGDMTLVTEEIKKLIDVTEVRNETFNVVTSAGVGLQQRDKVGYKIYCGNGDSKGITAHLTDTLGTVNGYDTQSTKCIVEGFGMDMKLSDYFLGKTHYNAKSISGIMGLKNAADIMYDVSPKDLGIIQPPWLPNIRFSKYALTDELMCWGSFGLSRCLPDHESNLLHP